VWGGDNIKKTKMKVEVQVLPKNSIPEEKLKYVVMGARYEDRWIFVRHRDRVTWEMPAGHIEAGESPVEAAERELFEETGASDFKMEYILDYTVTVNHKQESGRLYLADIALLDELQGFEIEETMLSGQLPSSLTYPDVQKVLFSNLSKAIPI